MNRILDRVREVSDLRNKGWTDETILGLMADYIDQGTGDDFLRFVGERADEEDAMHAGLCKDDIDAYVDNGGVCCPYPDCLSENIDTMAHDVGEGEITQHIRCMSCGREWEDVYTLSDVREI